MKKQSLLYTLSLLLLLFLTGCTNTDRPLTGEHNGIVSDIPSPTPTFEEFTTDIFIKEITSDTISLRYFLSRPEAYGIASYPITLGSVMDSVSPDESCADLYEQLLNYDASSFYEEEYFTYRSLMHHLELSMKNNFSPYLSELLGPTTGYQIQLPVILAEYRFDSADDVEHYLALLPCVYDYFADIAKFERKKSENGYFMQDEIAKEIIAQCNDFVKDIDHHFLISTFEERLEELDLSISEKTEYIVKNRTALHSYLFPAYDLLAEALTECLGTGTNPYGLAHFEDGKEFYALLTAYNTGSDKSMEEMKALLATAITDGCQQMAFSLTEEPAIYDSALSPDYPETDPEQIMKYLIAKSSEDFPFIDSGDCRIKSIPKALELYASPAMYLVPPIDDYESGAIYINYHSRYNADALFPTIAHEGYPGHLYQTIATLSVDTSPLRYLLSPTGYEEGWATYAETYCYKYAGFSDALTSFLQADQIATLCLYALSDIYIHYDGYTPEQLSEFLADYGFTDSSARLIYRTLLSEPGAYLPYAVGFLEFTELRNLAVELWNEEYSDYAFHEFLLEHGPMPFEELKELMRSPR